MKRPTLAAIFLPLIVIAPRARAQDDGWRWEPKRPRKFTVGEKYVKEIEETQHLVTHVTKPGDREDHDEDRVLAAKWIGEVLAVDADGKMKKERVRIVRWRSEHKAAEPDKSLEGRTVLVEITGEKRIAAIEGDVTKLSRAALGWVDGELAKRGSAKDRDDPLLPTKPLAPGEEWSVDPELVAKDMLHGAPIDAAASSVKGKISDVHVKNGVHFGRIELRLIHKLKKFPNTEIDWKEGGVRECIAIGEGSLEIWKQRQASLKMTVKLKGVAEKEGPGGVVRVELSDETSYESTTRDLAKEDEADAPKPGEGAKSEGLPPPKPR